MLENDITCQDVLEQWNAAAETYADEQTDAPHSQFNRKFVRQFVPNVQELDVLDAGCGNGWYSRYFAGRGANVSACDGARGMLEIARRDYPQQRFDEVNLLVPWPYEDTSFDLVFSNLVLMDLPELDNFISETVRVLKPGGMFVFSIVHPCFFRTNWLVDANRQPHYKQAPNYIKPMRDQNHFWGPTSHFHRPLADYLNPCMAKGLNLREIQEPGFASSAATARFPLFLFAKFIKG